MNSISQINKMGQSIWYDNVERKLLVTGEMDRLIAQGIGGVTSNPTIFERAITSSEAYDQDILSAVLQNRSVDEIYDLLTFEDIRQVADLLIPVYEKSQHTDGFVSIEVPPTLSKNKEATIREAHRLYESIGRANVMIKVPATSEGISAVQQLIKDGIHVNVTLIFSVQTYKKVIEAYLSGLESRHRNGESLSVSSVASFFISRVDTFVDRLIREQHLDSNLLGKAAIANAKIAYKLFEEAFSSARFEKLRSAGAQVQRPLWASTSTKDPNYSEMMYVSSLIGPHTVNTVPPNTLAAILKYDGPLTPTIHQDSPESKALFMEYEQNGISLTAVTDQLLNEGLAAFEKSFEALMANLRDKVQQFQANVNSPS